jgi:glycolate dehydrogenase FAD-linked subunit
MVYNPNVTSKIQVARALAQVVGDKYVLSDSDDLRVYSYDASNNTAVPDFVVVPENAEQISRVVKIARQHGLCIVPRGAGTGLCGAVIPIAGGIMISFARMKQIVEIDYENRIATVEAGLVNLDLSAAIADRGYFYAPDPGSQSASTIGGNIAANAGGPHCLAYGVTANHIVGLQVVLDNGEIVWLGGKSPDAPGFNLVSAFIGSEGTLGIIAQAMVRLLPLPDAIRTMLAIFNSVEDACRTVSAIIAAGVTPAALELLDQISLRAIENAMHAGYPTDAGAVLLIEVDGPHEGLDEFQLLITDICNEFNAREIRIAHTPEERTELWRGRKNAMPALGRLAQNIYIQDGCVPRSKLPEVLARTEEIAAKYHLVIANFFHAGDGNLHPNLLFDMRDPGAYDRVSRAGEEILKMCVDVGGTISGEHGVGIEKLDYMPWIFSEDDLKEMLKLRAAICPSGIFNPCKTIPQGASCVEMTQRNLSHQVSRGEMWV